jgi:pimeloyl-ACP methyl ester carboxylesterase
LHVVEVGQGPAVILCHGFPDVWIGWRRQMEALAEAGYRAIALDMRGYGRSSGPDDPLAYTALHALGDVVGMMDAMGLPHAALVGHDFGAAVAWYGAMLRPDRIRAVFAISVPFTRPGGPSLFESMEEAGKAGSFYMFRQRLPQAMHEWDGAPSAYASFLHWSSGAPPEEERWDPFDERRSMWRPAPVDGPLWADQADIAYAAEEFSRSGFRKPLYWYHSLQSFSDVTRAFTGMRVERPAFFIWGEVDGLTRMRDFDERTLRRGVPALHAAVRLPAVGHWPHREAPEVVNRHLVKFVGDAYQEG